MDEPSSSVLDEEHAQADRDFTRYLHFCRSIGLEQVGSTAIEIGYRTPLFEVAALETQGIRPPNTWRYGTSVVLQQIGDGRRRGVVSLRRTFRRNWCSRRSDTSARRLRSLYPEERAGHRQRVPLGQQASLWKEPA